MEIIPVIDLMGDQVVRGVGGRRSEYQPISSCVAPTASMKTCVRSLAEAFAMRQLYVADLDAIQGHREQPVPWRDVLRETTATLWLDVGISALRDLRVLLDELGGLSDRCRPIISTESLLDRKSLTRLIQQVGGDKAVFSLDLFRGRVRARDTYWLERSPREIVAEVAALGVRSIIVLDIANVGSQSGVSTQELCRSISAQYPEVELISGGGVRNREDLQQLSDAGCSGVLASSALHQGELLAADFEWARQLGG